MDAVGDLFEEIIMCEQRYHGEGYKEGFAEGNHVGESEGKQYGAIYGAQAGSEIGCYLGFASTWRLLLSSGNDDHQRRKIKALDLLIKMIQNSSLEDPTNYNLQEEITKIRGKVKQVCSMLNIQPDFKISFDGAGLPFE
ncbi:hypothetical protein GDO86_008535 [Hymenochirus boettgeri]|uniref:Oral cancer overexpressed 1 n=1 Tax=Hymenochirus boettgeri TaxID=247094 RepID=A0A8T2IXY6_9PIPI|nr:hypothetical protein GDO86_008535 [Hymenochirus boettgeri]